MKLKTLIFIKILRTTKAKCKSKNFLDGFFINKIVIIIMPIPLIKAGLTGLRYALRPINNLILKKFKSVGKDTYSYKFFEEFG